MLRRKMGKRKADKLVLQWVPKKTVKPPPIKFYLGVLEKYTRKQPKKKSVALTHVYQGDDIKQHMTDTRSLMI